MPSVCIDIQSAVAQRAGVGRYTHRLVEHLAPQANGDALSLFYFDFKRRGDTLNAPGATRRTVRWVPGRIAQRSWRTLGWPSFDTFAGAADVYHFPNFICPPLRRGKAVVTIHDLAFLRLPETIEEGNYRFLMSHIHKTVERADAIITVSDFTAREVVELLHVPPERVIPIRSGLDLPASIPTPHDVTRMRRALELDQPYLLTVGTLEPRKNIPFAIDVFERLTAFNGDLVIAGMKGWKCEPIMDRIRTSSRAGRIRYLEYVDDSLLPSLYAGAEVFLFPSLYEGFGFTPMESMAVGVPVVSADTGSLPEVLGDAALLVHGFDPELWVRDVEYILHDDARRAALAEKGLAHVRNFQWSETAAKTWQLYRSL